MSEDLVVRKKKPSFRQPDTVVPVHFGRTFREYDSIERPVELDVDTHVRLLALHLQMLDLDRVRHDLQRPGLVVRALQLASAGRQWQAHVVAAGSVLQR